MRAHVIALAAFAAFAAASGCRCGDSAGPTPDVGAADDGSGAGPEVSALPEAEPNDDTERANRLPIDRPVAGAVSADDVDVFTLPPADDAVDIVVTATAPISLEIARPQDAASYIVPIAADEATRLPRISRDATLAFTVRGAAEYTITASNADAPACGFALEPDDMTSPGARAASVPATLTGCIATPNDVDYFRIPAASLEGLEGFGLTVAGVPGVSLAVALHAGGDVIAELAGRDGEELAFPNLRAPADGDIVVAVRSLSGASETAPYRVALRRLPPLAGVVELEPNDTAATATQLSAIGLVNGYLHRVGDVDHFRLVTPEPTVVRMLAEPPPSVDIQVQLLGAASPLVIDQARVGGQERVCSLRIDPEVGVDFVVSARAQERTQLEPYLLHFELFDGATWELEPNDDLTEALAAAAADARTSTEVGLRLQEGPLASFVQGYVFPPGDVDRFVVRVTSDPTAEITYKSITLRLDPGGATDYALELFDNDGAAVAVSNNGRLGEAESIAVDLPAGLFVAQVTLLAGDACGQPYRLSVSQTEATVPSIFDLPPAPLPIEDGSGDLPLGEPRRFQPPDRDGSGEPTLLERRVPPPRQPRDTLPDVDPVLEPLQPRQAPPQGPVFVAPSGL